jgi:hypothetical protein
MIGEISSRIAQRDFAKRFECGELRADDQMPELERQGFSQTTGLLQLRVLRLGFFQDGDVGVGVFPEG